MQNTFWTARITRLLAGGVAVAVVIVLSKA
jgi:hypothetical protein